LRKIASDATEQCRRQPRAGNLRAHLHAEEFRHAVTEHLGDQEDRLGLDHPASHREFQRQSFEARRGERTPEGIHAKIAGERGQRSEEREGQVVALQR
jgi:hypothetical protein